MSIEIVNKTKQAKEETTNTSQSCTPKSRTMQNEETYNQKERKRNVF